MRDVRMAGYKYFGDNIETNAAEHIPIKITKHSLSNPCDTLEVVYGGYKSDGNDPPTFTYTRYKVTYKCVEDDRVDKEDPDGKTLYETYKLKKLQKAKHIWTGSGWGNDPDNDGNNETYDFATLVEYVEDLIFIPIDDVPSNIKEAFISAEDKNILSKLGIRIGAKYFFVPNFLKKASMELLAVLWCIFYDHKFDGFLPWPLFLSRYSKFIIWSSFCTLESVIRSLSSYLERTCTGALFYSRARIP